MKKIYLILILALFFSLPKLQAKARFWEGNVSTDWTDAANWKNGVPVGNDNTTIQVASIYPVIASGVIAVVGKLTINDGATLTIESGGTLTVNNALVNSTGSAGLVIKSDANGTGSLIHETDVINATVEQYLSAEAWHYVSSPITGAMSYVFYDIYLRSFDEPSYSWNPNITDNVGLTNMLGYAAWVPTSDATVSFEGPLNNGSQSLAITHQATGTNSGWNLVGNPFPSALDWDATSGWSRTNVDNTIYFWEGVGGTSGAGNYHYYNGTEALPTPGIEGVGTGDATRYIPPMQGYFIHISVDGSFGVDNDARVHNDQAYWKSTEDYETPIIRLQAENTSGLADEAIIRFFPEATPEHDGAFDAFKLEGYMYPQLYSLTPEKESLAINTLPEYQNGTIIPLGIVSPEEGEYSISLTEFENFEYGTEVYLEDLLTANMHNLSENSEYSFMSNPDQDPNRFLLHFVVNAAGISLTNSSDLNIYSNDKNVYIQLPENNISAQVNIFNMMGQKVQYETISGYGVSHLSVKSQSGYYLVTVQMGSQYYTEKVYIK